METAEIVKIAVSAAPYSIDKPYDYLVPPELLETAVPGVRVTVPFGRGNRTSEGIILARTPGEKMQGLKPLLSVLDRGPVLDGDGIALALWLRQRYFCTLFEAVKAILPAGLWYQIREVWHVAEGMDRCAADGAATGIRRAAPVLDALFAAGGSAELSVLEEACGKEAGTVLRALQKAGVTVCETAARRRIGDKSRRMVELAVSAEEAASLTEKRSSPQRREAVRLLAAEGRMSAAEVCYFTGVSMAALRGMEKAGIVAFSAEEELRLPDLTAVEPSGPIVLNEEQEAAFQSIRTLTKTGKPEAVLLQGVTGSGKTQVYLRLVQEILSRGRRAMVLVPEIVLTPQMMRRFSACFGDQVAMLHSSLRMTERYDQWKRIRRGEVQVVLGTRSAIFAPLKNVGLIVLDEEQESSYQSENPPRYHTRDVAKYLCARDKSTLVLGSATPAVETAWNAEHGIYHKALLRQRYNRQALPEVLVADLKQEIRAGNAGMVGQVLRTELEENLRRGEQSILLLNRRGSSRYLLCGECGHVPECPRCSVAPTYHSANGRLMCHYCGHSERSSDTCPVCGGIMKHVGTGTQKVEEELHDLFPGTEVLRMDADTVTATRGHEMILNQFRRKGVPVLVGTQMVAKGLDFENVTLVGVVSADQSLYTGDFRAGERTFSLLTQVIGRAGRGTKTGQAIIQTYTPDHEIIQCAARQDYDQFYDEEIQQRRLRGYPPFLDLLVRTASGLEESAVLHTCLRLRQALEKALTAPEYRDLEVQLLGPAPAAVAKINDRYRYRLTMRGKNQKRLRELVAHLLRQAQRDPRNRGVSLFADINPID